MTVKTSTVIFTISFLSTIFNCAGLTATNDLTYLAGMVVSVLGLFAGALASDTEMRRANELNKINNK